MKSNTWAKAVSLAAAASFMALTTTHAADTPPAPAPEPAQKEHLTKIGMLSCDSYGGIGWVIGSSSELSCTFTDRGGGEEFYTGDITKVGPDLGFKRHERLLWAVYAPGYQVPRGRLDGTYLGLSASAGLGLGVGANVLVGNLRNNLNLIPISVSGSVGVNASAGIGALTLSSDTASR
ncbi:MAG: DUF992 domain-containing protein [Pseudomonadota bacterium]